MEVPGDRLGGNGANAEVALVCRAGTGDIAIRAPAAVEDCVYDRLKVLESLCHMALKSERAPPAPPGCSAAVNSCRLPARGQFSAKYEGQSQGGGSQVMGEGNADARPRRTFRLPRESEFHDGVGDIGLCACEGLVDFPLWRDKVPRFLVEECGLQAEMIDEENPGAWEGFFEGHRGTDDMSMGSWQAPTDGGGAQVRSRMGLY